MIPDWFQEAIDHPNKHRGIDSLLDKIYDWYDDEDYASVDEFLSKLEEEDFKSLPSVLLVGLLTTTLPSAHLLPSRPSVYSWVYVELERRGESANLILRGLHGSDADATKAHNQIFSGLLGSPPIPTKE